MNTWAPLWSQIVDSTLWEEPLEVRVLFLTMLAIKDPDHTVRMPLRRLCKKAGMEPDLVQSALAILLSPDTKSMDPQEHEGRRLQVVEGGWLILNGEYYRQEMSRLMRRLSKNEWQRKNRAEKRKSPRPVKSATEHAIERAESAGDNGSATRLAEMADGVAPGTYQNQDRANSAT